MKNEIKIKFVENGTHKINIFFLITEVLCLNTTLCVLLSLMYLFIRENACKPKYNIYIAIILFQIIQKISINYIIIIFVLFHFIKRFFLALNNIQFLF